MKLIRPRTFVIYAMAAVAGVVLLHTSQNVQRADEKRAALERSIAREEERIHMLRAEWMHLNRPERLERLANEFLDLVPPKPQNILGDDEMVEGAEEPAESVAQPVAYERPVIKPPSKPEIAAQAPPPEEPVQSREEKAKSFSDVLGDLTDDKGGAP